MTGVHYTDIVADKSLANFVDSFWQSKNDTEEEYQFTTLPDGCMELVIRFHKNRFIDAELVNISKEPISFLMPAKQTKIGIRLKPLAKEYLFSQNNFGVYKSLDEILLGTIPLSQLFTFGFSDFSQSVSKVMLSVLKDRIPGSGKIQLFQLLNKTQGDIKVKELAQSAFWSERQINRYFNKQFGMPLKSYCTILKCYASYTQIKSGKFFPEQNFYDQPHFIREIKKHTGATPEKLWKNQNDRFIQFQQTKRE